MFEVNGLRLLEGPRQKFMVVNCVITPTYSKAPHPDAHVRLVRPITELRMAPWLSVIAPLSHPVQVYNMRYDCVSLTLILLCSCSGFSWTGCVQPWSLKGCLLYCSTSSCPWPSSGYRLSSTV